jgi:hypothetical protein
MDEFCVEFILMCSEAEQQITVYVINKFRNRLIKYRIVRVSMAVTYSIGAWFESRLGRMVSDRFLPRPLQFVIHSSSYKSTFYGVYRKVSLTGEWRYSSSSS